MNEPLFPLTFECLYLLRFLKDCQKNENPGWNSSFVGRISDQLQLVLESSQTSLSLTPYIQGSRKSSGFYLKIYLTSDVYPSPHHVVRANMSPHLDFLFLLFFAFFFCSLAKALTASLILRPAYLVSDCEPPSCFWDSYSSFPPSRSFSFALASPWDRLSPEILMAHCLTSSWCLLKTEVFPDFSLQTSRSHPFLSPYSA